MLKEQYDAVWQNLSVNARTCPSEAASLWIYTQGMIWPANVPHHAVHPETIQSGFVKHLCVILSLIKNG